MAGTRAGTDDEKLGRARDSTLCDGARSDIDGDPLDRDPELLVVDVLDGKITPEVARGAYGVVLTAEGDAVNRLATKECPEERHRQRGPVTWTFDRGADGLLV